jgi:hypothetical protein
VNRSNFTEVELRSPRHRDGSRTRIGRHTLHGPTQHRGVAGLAGRNGSIASDKYQSLGLTSITFRSTGENGAMPINLANWTVVSSEPSAGTAVQMDDPIVVTVKQPIDPVPMTTEAVDILPAVNGQDSNCYATLGGRAC